MSSVLTAHEILCNIVLALADYQPPTVEEEAMPIKIDQGKCATCGYCVTSCPQNAIVLKDKKAIVIPERCNDCCHCIGKCLMQAIELEKSAGEGGPPRDGKQRE